MSPFTLENPVFATYVVAAGLAILKMIGHAFLTVQRMLSTKGGWASPEDLRRTPLNPNPDPAQLGPNDAVDRARRMHRNEGENTPPFLVAGLLFVAAAPPAWLATLLLYGYVAARVAHAWAYATARDHEVRATFFTLGALSTVTMAAYAIVAALRA
jgi:glutathione S-transferase